MRKFYTDDTLIQLTKELTDQLRRNRTVDWDKRESARAHMRMLVKRLLKKYKYPPDEAADALKTVMRQCELWVDSTETEAHDYAVSRFNWSTAFEEQTRNDDLPAAAEGSAWNTERPQRG